MTIDDIEKFIADAYIQYAESNIHKQTHSDSLDVRVINIKPKRKY